MRGEGQQFILCLCAPCTNLWSFKKWDSDRNIDKNIRKCYDDINIQERSGSYDE